MVCLTRLQALRPSRRPIELSQVRSLGSLKTEILAVVWDSGVVVESPDSIFVAIAC
jgi:hypothetical protein